MHFETWIKMNDSIKLLAQIFMFQNVLPVYNAELITLELCFNGHFLVGIHDVGR